MNVHLRIASRTLRTVVTLTVLSALNGCTAQDQTKSRSLEIQMINNPAPLTSALPHVSSNANEVVVSWVHETSTGHALAFTRSSQHALQFSEVQQIAEGNDWFVNWADFPMVFLGSTGQLAAHWLQRTTPDGYGYDINYATSIDGTVWTPPSLLHTDGTHTEHGFVSWFEYKERLGAIWLDGRHTQPSDQPTSHHADGAMTLRSKFLGDASVEVDAKVCDCCQTSAITTDRGPVFFYRNRSEEEIRDIYVAHSTNSNSTTAPTPLHNDKWRIDGCPVNGPQADAIENNIVTAWFTMAEGDPQVKVSRSTDAGRTFSAPIILSASKPLGRVDTVMLNAQLTLVSFLENDDNNNAKWRVALLDEQLNVVTIENLATVANARGSGLVRMTRLSPPNLVQGTDSTISSGIALAAWSEGVDKNSRIRTAMLSVN